MTVLEQIQQLEESVTTRRLREAIVTEDGNAWLLDVEKQIQKLRSQLDEG